MKKLNLGESIFLSNTGWNMINSQNTLEFMRERYVYVNYYEQKPPYEYLHDLQKDPNQLVNLKDDPHYLAIFQEMRKKCNRLEYNIKNN